MQYPEEPFVPLEVGDYQAMLDAGTPHLLLDVREPMEYEQAHIDGAVLIPFGELMWRADELRDHDHIVVVCRTGNRSAMACMGLADMGIEATLYNLEGGIVAWAREGHSYVQGVE